MNCPSCNAPVSPSADRCSNCGYTLTPASTEASGESPTTRRSAAPGSAGRATARGRGSPQNAPAPDVMELDDSFAALERLVGTAPGAEAPAGLSSPSSSAVRVELQRQYDALGPVNDPASRAGELVFLGSIGASLAVLGLTMADFNHLIGADNIFTGAVTDDLLEWLSDNGWLRLS